MAWINLDPCNFQLSVGFEKWIFNVSLFDYPMGEIRNEKIGDVFQIK